MRKVFSLQASLLTSANMKSDCMKQNQVIDYQENLNLGGNEATCVPHPPDKEKGKSDNDEEIDHRQKFFASTKLTNCHRLFVRS